VTYGRFQTLKMDSRKAFGTEQPPALRPSLAPPLRLHGGDTKGIQSLSNRNLLITQTGITPRDIFCNRNLINEAPFFNEDIDFESTDHELIVDLGTPHKSIFKNYLAQLVVSVSSPMA
jgi:hypothetical protein